MPDCLCHAGLDPVSRGCWTPDQVRGDSAGRGHGGVWGDRLSMSELLGSDPDCF